MPAEQTLLPELKKPPELTMPAEQALIAEARAHARRRRRKIALIVTAAAAIVSAAGALAAPTVFGGHHAVGVASSAPGPAIRTGIVIGHLDACYGAAGLPGRPLPVTPGTVTAVRGTGGWKRMGHGTWRLIVPSGPVVARARISNNYHQVFRFALPPGTYVLIGRYDNISYSGGHARYLGGSIPGLVIYTEVSVSAGKTLHTDLPGPCK